MPDGSKRKDAEKLFLSVFPEDEEQVYSDSDLYDVQVRDLINNYIANTRSSDGTFNLLAYGDTIGEVESRGNPLAHQVGGGPGRGKYQFEPDGAATASRRLKALSTALGFKNPDWNREDSVRDATKLTEAQQDILFLADKLQARDINLKDLADGDISGEDFWVKHHWRGNASGTNSAEEAQRRHHYRETVKDMNKE